MLSKVTTSKRLPGLDLLKSILAVMIVVRHTGLISLAPLKGTELSWTPFSLTAIAYMNLQNLAVPTFMMISLWLFCKKRVESPSYFSKRISRLFEIILFWWAIYALVGAFTPYSLFPKTISGYLAIPFIDGAMYFLGSMIVQILLIEVIVRLLERVNPRLEGTILIASIIIGFLVSIVVRLWVLDAPGVISLIADHGHIVFFAYGPTALLLVRKSNKEASIILLLISLGMTVLYWVVQIPISELMVMPTLRFFQFGYLYPPVVFLAALLLILFSQVNKENGKVIKAISPWVLGIYLVHPIIIPLARPLLGKWMLVDNMPGGGFTCLGSFLY